jgi:acetyl-CoA carboxylase carboxyl transferase subunit beta
VLTLVDTPGAANDAAAEREAIGAAICDVFAAVAAARVPITTLVIGEGGSGGALAIASPTDIWIAPDGYFAVIVPEAATAILKGTDVPETARRLQLRPQELVELGIVQGIARP